MRLPFVSATLHPARARKKGCPGSCASSLAFLGGLSLDYQIHEISEDIANLSVAQKLALSCITLNIFFGIQAWLTSRTVFLNIIFCSFYFVPAVSLLIIGGVW